MKCNIGKADRVIRTVAGLAIIGTGVYLQSWWGVIGIVPLATAALGFCPAYVPFGITSCKSASTQ